MHLRRGFMALIVQSLGYSKYLETSPRLVNGDGRMACGVVWVHGK